MAPNLFEKKKNSWNRTRFRAYLALFPCISVSVGFINKSACCAAVQLRRFPTMWSALFDFLRLFFLFLLDFRPIERPLRALETLEHEKKAHEIPPPGKTKPETAARNEERTRRWRRRRPCDPRAARRRPVAGAGGGAKEAGPVADWSPSVERSPPLAALAAAVAIGRDSSSDPPLSFDRPVFFFFFRHSAFRSIQNDVIQLEGTWAHLLFSAGVGQVSVSLATFSVDVSFFFSFSID